MELEITTPEVFEPLIKPARYKGIHGGRGSGKSHFFGEMAIESLIEDPNKRGVCIREVQKSLDQSVKHLLEIKIEKMGVGHYFDVQNSVIKSKMGDGQIIFQGMQNHTADSIKSLEGYDWAWVEEAQGLSHRSLELLRPTIRKENKETGEQSELWFSWNPENPTDPVDRLLRGKHVPDNWTVIEANYMDNPWFPNVLRDEMEYDKSRDSDKYEHVWLGGYQKNSEKRVFKNWRVEEFETPKDAILRFGADWGFAVDPTALVRLWIEGRKLYIDYEAYMVNCEIVNTPELFLTVPESEKWPIVADSSRPETISHVRNDGFPRIMGAVKGPGSIEDGIEFLKNYDIIVHPRCKHVIYELTHYSFKVDPLTGEILSVLEDKHNHVIDALRYACESIRRIQTELKEEEEEEEYYPESWEGN
jgi:phage terminase large subunit